MGFEPTTDSLATNHSTAELCLHCLVVSPRIELGFLAYETSRFTLKRKTRNLAERAEIESDPVARAIFLAGSPRTQSGSLSNVWYRRWDSNPHCNAPKARASYQLGYSGIVFYLVVKLDIRDQSFRSRWV